MKTDALIRELLDAARRVHETHGPGFVESIYARALLSELRNRGLAIERERQVKIWYGSLIVGKHNLDLVIERTAIVELKANRGLLPIHTAQLRSYRLAHGVFGRNSCQFRSAHSEWEVFHREDFAEKTE